MRAAIVLCAITLICDRAVQRVTGDQNESNCSMSTLLPYQLHLTFIMLCSVWRKAKIIESHHQCISSFVCQVQKLNSDACLNQGNFGASRAL